MLLRNYKALPSLGSLATFEVAAKHLSFTVAASELHVTQAAISQQIRILEKALDTPLFHRLHNSLELTQEGMLLLRAVQQGLGTIGTTVNAILGLEREDQTVTISATTWVSHCFLWPIVRRYINTHPEARIVILASDEDASLHDFQEVDLALVCGNERFDAGDRLHFLFHEIVQPVCSPGYLEKYGPFPEADSLNQARLLHLHQRHWHAMAIGWQPLDWENWFTSQGTILTSPFPHFCSNSYPLLLQAAIEGEGVVLGWRHMVHRYIHSGALVYACNHQCVVERGNFLKINEKKSRTKLHTQGIIDRILEEAVHIRYRGHDEGLPGAYSAGGRAL